MECDVATVNGALPDNEVAVGDELLVTCREKLVVEVRAMVLYTSERCVSGDCVAVSNSTPLL